MSAARGALIVVAGLAATFCAGHRGGNAQSACAPVTGAVAASTSLASMAGRFIITMAATAGPQNGQVVAGYLTLRPAPAGTPAPGARVRTAFVGVTDIRLETVGALRLGDTGSEDARAPGIAVYEQRAASGAPTLTARIGSIITAPQDPGMMQIEGSYTALYIRQVSASGFAGGWASARGGTMGNEARGHFCAVRVQD